MRDFIKSTLRLSWAMSLFGLQQLENVVENPSKPKNKTGTAFDSVSRATEDKMSGAIKDAFKAGDKLQSGMVDRIFSALPSRPQLADPAPAGRHGSHCATDSASVTPLTYP